jgi:hypothetical protein
MTNEEHNKYVAYSFFGYAGFQLFWLVVMAVIFTLFLGSMPGPPGQPAFPFLEFMLAFMVIFQLIFTLPSAIAGWAMLKRKRWARIASIIGAVLAAMSVPIGTAAAVYALRFWMGDNWKGLYPGDDDDDRHSVRSLEPGDRTSTTDDFTRSEEWMKQPPDWR